MGSRTLRLDLHCCSGFSLVAMSWAGSLVVMGGLHVVVASLIVELGF